MIVVGVSRNSAWQGKRKLGRGKEIDRGRDEKLVTRRREREVVYSSLLSREGCPLQQNRLSSLRKFQI